MANTTSAATVASTITTPDPLNTTVSVKVTTVTPEPPTNATEPDTTSTTQTQTTQLSTTTGPDSNNTGVIVGGVVGGFVFVGIIVILVLGYRRRQKSKTPKEKPMLPGKYDLEEFDKKRTENHSQDSGGNTESPYHNTKITGEPNEKTDPALDDEGYMKKQKKKKGKKDTGGRQNSMPPHPAPSVPADTATGEAGMEAYENMTNESMTKSAIVKQNKTNLSKVPNKNKMDKDKRNVRYTKDPKYVNGRDQSLSESTGTDKHYVNLEAKAGGLGHYANVDQTKINESPEISEVSEELYENPEPRT